jgi:hypothetical protein
MQHHLDYGLRIQTEPKHTNLYSWAINEVAPDGSLIDRDQIPWEWSSFFTATSCVLTNRFEIAKPFEFFTPQPEAPPPQIEKDQIIHMTLRPGAWREGEWDNVVQFSMFGTKRSIQDFTLQVRPLNDPAEAERCTAWGTVAYTAEVDFRDRTQDDCVCFFLYVKRETFESYVALINAGAVDAILFSVGSVDGFYSAWSPSISTMKVKVLPRGNEPKIDLPLGFEGEPPRLGRVQAARLLMHRHLFELSKALPLPIEGEVASRPSASPILRGASETDQRLLPVLVSLKQAAWVAVAILVVIAVMALQKH